MIEKKIECCIGTDRAGNVRARLSLLVVENDKVISEQYHSVSIEPGADKTAIKSAIDAHLTDQNSSIPGAPWPTIPDEAWTDVVAHCAIVQKPELVAKFQEMRAARKETD